MYFTYYHSVTVAYLQPLNSNYMADNTNSLSISENDLFNELSQLIEQSKQQVAIQANSAVTILFWQVGNRINQDILQNKRAEYGKQIVSTLSSQLENKYGRNFEVKNLRRMMQFAEQFTDFQIVVTLSRQLSWSHYLAILPIKTSQKKRMQNPLQYSIKTLR